MPKNTHTPGCAKCSNIAQCNQKPKAIKEDGFSVCYVAPKPPLGKREARKLYGDGAGLNGSPSFFWESLVKSN